MVFNLSDLVNNHPRNGSSCPDPAALHQPTSSSGQAQALQQMRQQLIQGHSNDVSELPIADPVVVLPCRASTGQDEILKEIWGFLKDDKVGMVGIYGMGGVGKTTLLKRINNDLEGTCDFDVVIWVVVSKEVNLNRIQKTILQRLGLPYNDDTTINQAAIFKALRKRKFVLLLDDLWEGLDLEEIGLLTHNEESRCKVLFTTRSEDVCGRMQCHRKVRVNCLVWNKAWDLFKKNVGAEPLATHSEIEKLAQKVARECQGLPLALIVIARAMTCKRTIQEWKHALTTLQNSPFEISDTEKDMYYRLKLSYDMLPNDDIRNCFLHCSLFPKYFSVDKEELIKYWMEEGFLGGCENIDETVNKGYDVIGILTVSCLLDEVDNNIQSLSYKEDKSVKMHDVIRDMALWLASECGLTKGKFLVKAGIGLHETPKAEKWREAERISLMQNDLTQLSGDPMCPKLLTLFLQLNKSSKPLQVSESFFQFMPLLRVLDLSYTTLMVLPTSIGQLRQLQYLNLSGTSLTSLPKEIGNLENLRRLDVSRMAKQIRFPQKTISRLSKLQVYAEFEDFLHRDTESEILVISELERLKFLSDVSITIRNSSSLDYLIGSQEFAQCITNLGIHRCQYMKYLQLPPNFGSKLRELTISHCDLLEDIEIGPEANFDGGQQILSGIELLQFKDNCWLKRILVGSALGQCLQRLRKLVIHRCRVLADISWLKYLPCLEYLDIKDNDVMKELFSSQNEVKGRFITFPTMKILKISEFGNLKRICEDVVTFPSLEFLKVYKCHYLKKLPPGMLNEKRTLRIIEGDEKWWNRLEWEDDLLKSHFQPLFRDDINSQIEEFIERFNNKLRFERTSDYNKRLQQLMEQIRRVTTIAD